MGERRNPGGGLAIRDFKDVETIVQSPNHITVQPCARQAIDSNAILCALFQGLQRLLASEIVTRKPSASSVLTEPECHGKYGLVRHLSRLKSAQGRAGAAGSIMVNIGTQVRTGRAWASRQP